MILQHVDRNIGPAAYNALGDNQLLVTSIFYTLQGEGPYAGCPAVFLRLAGCNRGRKDDMGCQFCDTRFYFDEGKVMTFIEITQQIAKLLNGKAALTVITGGEPMLQDNLSRFVQHHRTVFTGTSIQIESNGDRLAKHWPSAGYAQIVVSPKVNKNGYTKPNPEVLKAALCFKFVISADPTSSYHSLPDWIMRGDSVRPERVYVSPMTEYLQAVPPGMMASAWDKGLIDHVATRANYRRAAALALEHGLRVSLQTHLWLELE